MFLCNNELIWGFSSLRSIFTVLVAGYSQCFVQKNKPSCSYLPVSLHHSSVTTKTKAASRYFSIVWCWICSGRFTITSQFYWEGNRAWEGSARLMAPLSYNSPLVCRWTTASRCGCGVAPWRWRPPRRRFSIGCWGNRSCGKEACVTPPSSKLCPRTPKSIATSSRAKATAWAPGPHRSICCSGNEARRAQGFTGLWVLTCWDPQSGEDGRVTAKNTLKVAVWFKVGDSSVFCELWMGVDEILIQPWSQMWDDSICVSSWITSHCVTHITSLYDGVHKLWVTPE